MSGEFMVHETAVVDAGAAIGEGSRIWHFCHVMAGARIGKDCVLGQNVFVGGEVAIGDGCKIQNNVSLYDGVVLGDAVFVGPSAVFTNVTRPRAAFPRKDGFETTSVGDAATIGANATVRCGVALGTGALIAAGAVVLDDVPAFAVVAGVPPRPVGWACRCGERLVEPDLGCEGCGRRYAPDGDGLRMAEGC
jgi:UDP-2-acetamido-3-amino-2,3-dideoxy-glucuronate N-acetyltransferase